ncbi:MAG: hypothetical protein LBF93_11830 [Zoogloeaceae bacterium]|jgi:hypothetical protein|nr:hypothetical protein [Zoogloeaceae bacterium]
MLTEIEFMLAETRKGNRDFKDDILLYIRGYSLIVIRGAGLFGRNMGDFLVNAGIDPERILYWDMNAENLRKVGAQPVLLPFTRRRGKPRPIRTVA